MPQSTIIPPKFKAGTGRPCPPKQEELDWGLQALNIPSLWSETKGTGIKVAVLDSGCVLQHPDLIDQIASAADFTNSNVGAEDKRGHGTHCAGIIAAKQGNGGVVGVAPKARLLIGKIVPDGGALTIDPILQGIEWAISQGADIMSLSFGTLSPIPRIKAAIDKAIDKGLFIVCAAGNRAKAGVEYPAAYDNTIAVAALGEDGQIVNKSARGDELTIAAPGKNICSTYLNNGYKRLSGTSMATPFVVGVIALMLAKHRQHGGQTPVETQQQLIEHLQKTAIDIAAQGRDADSGWGLINPTKVV